MDKLTFRTRALMLAVGVLLVYGMAAAFGFVWDDFDFLINNPHLDWGSIPVYFTEPVHNLYRPLRGVYYIVTYQLFGLNPAPYHLLAVAYHAVISILLMRILELAGARGAAALAGAALFAFHPVHIQKVALIAAGFDLPADILTLIAVYYFAAHKTGADNKGLYKSLALFLVALFWAESAAAFPFIALALELFMPTGRKLTWSEKRIFIAGCVVILGMFITVRTGVLGGLQRGEEGWELSDIYLSMFPALLHYLRLLVIPYPLSPLSPVPLFEQPLNPFVILSAVIIITLIALAWRARRERPLVALGVFWFLAAWVPFSNIIPTGIITAERYIYLPSVAVCFFTVAAFQKGGTVRRYFLAGMGALFALLTAFQLPVYANGENLWKAAVERTPWRSIAYMNLAAYYNKTGRPEEAYNVMRLMKQRAVGGERPMLAMATAKMNQAGPAEAEKILLPYVRAFPENKTVMMNYLILTCLNGTEGWQDMAERYKDQLANPLYYERVGDCYAREGMGMAARDHYRRALLLQPRSQRLKKKLEAVGE